MEKWTWHMDANLEDGKVNATINSEDGKSKLVLTKISGKLVDAITSLLNSSYKWGAGDTYDVLKDIDKSVEDPSKGDGIEEDVDNKNLLAEQKQTIANLRRKVTNLEKVINEYENASHDTA